MAMANKPTPPPGASAKGVGRGQCARVYFNSADWPRKKLITRLVLSILFAPYCHQNDGITPPLRASAQLNILHIVYSSTPNNFGWLSRDYSLTGGRLKPQHDLLSIIFCCPNHLQNGKATSPHALHPPRATSPISLLPRTSTFGWLLCIPFKFRPLKAKSPFPLNF